MSVDEYFLRQASIFELRNIARQMGVLSPTIFKKEELIEKVLKIQNGEEKPQMPKSRQGRPPKSIFTNSSTQQTSTPTEKYVSYKDIINKVEHTPKETYNYLYTENRTKGYGVLADTSFNYGIQDTAEKENTYNEGYFYLVDNYGFVFDKNGSGDVDDVAFVPQTLISNCGLRNGDLLKFKSSYASSAKVKYVNEIISINETTTIMKNRPLFNKLEISAEDKDITEINFNKNGNKLLTIKEGSRNIFCIKSNAEMRNAIKEFNKFQEFFNVNLLIDAVPEDIAILKNSERIENFYTPIGESNKQCTQIINLAVERAKRLAESGKKVILVVSDAKKLIKQKNFSLEYCAEEIKNKSLDYCYLTLGSARKLTNNASITTFLFFKENEEKTPFENYILNEFKSLDCNIL